MLGVLCVFLIAKPISLRRLCLLYVFALVSTRFLLSIFCVESVASLSSTVATSITLLAWAFPLFNISWCVISARRLTLEALAPVSGFVRFTYGCALAALPLILLRSLTNPIHLVRLGELAQTLAVAAAVGLTLRIVVQIQGGSSEKQKKLNRMTVSRLCHVRHGTA